MHTIYSDYRGTWFQINDVDVDEVWSPKVNFRKVVSAENVPLWGTDQNYFFWINAKSHEMSYYQTMKVTVNCRFNFEDYPFDEHQCGLGFGIGANDITYIGFKPIQVLNRDSTPEELRGVREIPNEHLPYR